MLTITRTQLHSAIRAAFPAIGEADLYRATGAAVRAMYGATDTGMDHGPAEGLITADGNVITTSSNGATQPGSWRAERRARDLRDIGALRYFARMHDRTGARNAAAHCRDLANIFAASATWRAMPDSASVAPTTDLPDHRPGAPTAYHTVSDMYVRIVGTAHNGACFTIDHPQHGRVNVPVWSIDPATV